MKTELGIHKESVLVRPEGRRRVRTGILTLAAAAGLLSPGWASASERMSAAACFTDTDNLGDYRWSGAAIQNLSSGLGWRPRQVHCPITVDDGFAPKENISSVRVSILDMNNQFGAVHNFHVRVCLTPWGEGAVQCSATMELNPGTATGGFWSSVPANITEFLRDPARRFHYASLTVTIPASNGTPSALRGIEIFR